MELTMRDLARIASDYGHAQPRVSETRRGWVGTCGCGFRSARTPTSAQAEQLVGEHIIRAARSILAKKRASGRLAG